MTNSLDAQTKAPPRPAGGGGVCWMLMFMGLATMAPCVLLPEWREYQALHAVRQREEHRVAELKEALSREHQAFEAMQRDPAVIARLVRRDLRFHDPSETPIVVAPVSETPPAASVFVPQPVNPPAWIAAGERYLPHLNYDGVFCDETTRRLVMGLSLAILAVSMVLAPGRRGLAV